MIEYLRHELLAASNYIKDEVTTTEQQDAAISLTYTRLDNFFTIYTYSKTTFKLSGVITTN